MKREKSFPSGKTKGDGNWVNAPAFLFVSHECSIVKDGDQTIFEREPLENLANAGRLYAYKHSGF